MDVTSTLIQGVDPYQIMLSNYADILEKTNQQLNLWTNPYGLMIGLLAIIIAIVAIVVSFLLWKNSSDQKKRSEEFFKKQEENIEAQMGIIKERSEKENELSKQREKRAKEYEDSFNKLIAEYKTKLRGVDKENKKEIERLEKNIDELNKNKLSLSSYTIPEAMSDIGSLYGVYGLNDPIKSMICFGCGKGFQYKDQNNTATMITGGYGTKKKVFCPHCGAENYVS
ncbi:MAG: hypothetical protein ACD_18C00347G0034 [uncultured bacterium]|nr:MAG: hypothetical protein ACD_18C00347G0034 [uncultured bacterium]